jgi:hypothetical protein
MPLQKKQPIPDFMVVFITCVLLVWVYRGKKSNAKYFGDDEMIVIAFFITNLRHLKAPLLL